MDVEKTIKDIIEEFIDRIDTWFRFNIERIQGTWDYMRFIWSHNSYREWDFAYLYDLIEFKLKRMEKQLRKDDFVSSSRQTSDNIIKALNYYKLYKAVVDELPDDALTCQYKVANGLEQLAWELFHDTLKEEAQKWWS